MLVEFSVANYRSFKDTVTFSMVAANITAKDKQIDENNVFDAGSDLRLLKTAAIYGANASGKSNFAKAIGFMREFVLNSSRESQAIDAIGAEPFRLSTETEKQPSFFEIVFLLDGKRFRYGFKVDRQRVVAEWLYRTPTQREAKLFERHMDEIDVGGSFKEGRGIQSRTRRNALFLSVVAQFNGTIAHQILQWFEDLQVRLGILDIGDRISTIFHLEKNQYRDEIIQFVKKLDLGIDDIQLERGADLIPSSLLRTQEPLQTGALDLLPPGTFEAITHLLDTMQGHKGTEVRTVHRVFDEQGHQTALSLFDLDEHESEGTKKLFALAGSLVPALELGTVLVVDELDARLHPLITCAIIDLFNNPQTNPRNAQLIFTTHDTNLLSNTIFRRDQIWFAEKDRFGATQLYSLVEFKVRNDASFEKDYIGGRYGAIPFVGDLSRVLGNPDA